MPKVTLINLVIWLRIIINYLNALSEPVITKSHKLFSIIITSHILYSS